MPAEGLRHKLLDYRMRSMTTEPLPHAGKFQRNQPDSRPAHRQLDGQRQPDFANQPSVAQEVSRTRHIARRARPEDDEPGQLAEPREIHRWHRIPRMDSKNVREINVAVTDASASGANWFIAKLPAIHAAKTAPRWARCKPPQCPPPRPARQQSQPIRWPFSDLPPF